MSEADLRLLSLVMAAVVAGACGKPATSGIRADGGGDACSALKNVVPSSASHLASCSDTACGNAENPPTGGDHCSTVIACRSYPDEQLRCQWLHNMEHGHVVFLYNCPNGCAEVVAQLELLRDEAKKGSNGVARAIVAPDTKIPTRVAAVTWGWSWTGDEVDVDALRCLLTKQDVGAPEPGLGCTQ